MTISETQLERWSHQGLVEQSKQTYATIKSVLADENAPYAKYDFRIFLQGSYANNTNVRVESDVDIAICLTSSFGYNVDDLDEWERRAFAKSFIESEYSFENFRRDVFAWLRENLGGGVKAGNKAIFIPGGGSRRDADVLVCIEHKKYRSFFSREYAEFFKGVCFWTMSGKKIVNYPSQHYNNCATKHQNTGKRYKLNVRVMKNMRNAMQERNSLKVRCRSIVLSRRHVVERA